MSDIIIRPGGRSPVQIRAGVGSPISINATPVPGIVTSGLALYFDAANASSYTSGSSTIQDLSGNNRNAIIDGTLLYTGSYAGSFRFKKATPGHLKASSPTISIGAAGCTMAAWLTHETLLTSAGNSRYVSVQNSSPAADDLIIRHVYSTSSTPPNGTVEMIVFTSGLVRSLQIHNQLQTNVPVYIVGVWNGTTMTLYKNGVSIGTTTPGGTYTATTKTVTISSNSVESMDGQVHSTMVYSRALTAAEVLENYNAQKGKFGL